MNDILQNAWIELEKESLFFSYLRMNFDSMPTTSVRTIKVSITPQGKFRLLYNPNRLKNIGLILTKGILKHEIYHIIFGHIFIKPKNKRERGIWDLAMDAAVNQYIRELDVFAEPLDVMVAEGHAPDNEFFFVTAPMNLLNKTAEEYYKYAMDLLEKNKMIDIEEILEKRENNLDSHDFSSDIPEEMAFDIVSEFVTKAYDKSKDNLPDGIELAVSLMVTKPFFNWETMLRRFFGSSIIVEKYRTLMRPNRRYEDQPGWRSKMGPNIAIIIDTSGSIIEEEYNAFFSEIENIAKSLGGKLTLIQADSHIQNIMTYHKGNWKELVLKGKGSTDMQPAVDYVEENLRPEGIIIFTDGWVEVPHVQRRILFILSKKHNPDFLNNVIEYYGKNSVAIIN
jgi:predicted metal-dependent peptidase